MAKSIMELVGGAFQDFTDAELRTARDVFDLPPEKIRVIVSLLRASGQLDPEPLDGSANA